MHTERPFELRVPRWSNSVVKLEASLGGHRWHLLASFFFFFFTRVTGPRRSLSLKMSDTRVYQPPPTNHLLAHSITIPRSHSHQSDAAAMLSHRHVMLMFSFPLILYKCILPQQAYFTATSMLMHIRCRVGYRPEYGCDCLVCAIFARRRSDAEALFFLVYVVYLAIYDSG